MTWLWVPCHSAAYRSSPGKRQISPVSRRRENKRLTSASQRPQGTDKHPNESENDIHFLCHFDDAAANRSTDILSSKPLFGIYLLFVICYSVRHLESALSVITFSRFQTHELLSQHQVFTPFSPFRLSPLLSFIQKLSILIRVHPERTCGCIIHSLHPRLNRLITLWSTFTKEKEIR